MTRAALTVLGLTALAGLAGAQEDRIYVGSPTGSVYVADSDTGAFTYFACFCIGPIVSIQPLGSDMLVADSFGGLWQLDGVTGNFETGAWTGVGLVDMAVDGEEALLVTTEGELLRVPLSTGFPQTPVSAPAGVTSVVLFDGALFVGTASGEIHRLGAGESEWSVFGVLPAGVRTLTARPESLVAADVQGNAKRLHWNAAPEDGYYVTTNVVDAAFTGGRTLFTQSPGEVQVFDAETSALVATWSVPVEASAIFVSPGSVCKADTNRNGVLEAGDFGAWIAAFNRNDFVADQNNDLAVTPADFGAWIGAYNQGCE